MRSAILSTSTRHHTKFTSNNLLLILQSTTKSFSIKIIDLLWKINGVRKGNKRFEYPVKYPRTLFLSLLNMQNSEWNIWCGRCHYINGIIHGGRRRKKPVKIDNSFVCASVAASLPFDATLYSIRRIIFTFDNWVVAISWHLSSCITQL